MKCVLMCHYNLFFSTGHDTAPGEQSKKYRPLFLDHFDKKEQEKRVRNDRSLVFVMTYELFEFSVFILCFWQTYCTLNYYLFNWMLSCLRQEVKVQRITLRWSSWRRSNMLGRADLLSHNSTRRHNHPRYYI